MKQPTIIFGLGCYRLILLGVILILPLRAIEGEPVFQSSPSIPSSIAELAVQKSLISYPDNRPGRSSFVRAYSDAFLDSLRYGSRFEGLTKLYGDEASQRGYEQARELILSEHDKPWLSPAEFGYAMIELEGVYRHAFEISEFIATGGEKLHLNRGEAKTVPAAKKIRIKAWISPKSAMGYGHMNQWKQELIVIEVLTKEGA